MSITVYFKTIECPKCNGTGFILAEGTMSHKDCPKCGGIGVIKEVY